MRQRSVNLRESRQRRNRQRTLRIVLVEALVGILIGLSFGAMTWVALITSTMH